MTASHPSTHSLSLPAAPEDLFALLKPRVMSLSLFTALVGMLMAPASGSILLGAAALFAIAMGAGAAGCLNMWWDSEIDGRMARTAQRPIPSGRVHPGEALGFGMALALGSVLLLGLVANWIAAFFLGITIFFYVVIYSILLKTATPQNIVIGGIAGALPPVVGEAAISGAVTWATWALFLIIFLWTPPHFWALALLRAEDYRRVGIPMLPTVSGIPKTQRSIMIYTVLLVPSGFLPLITSGGGSLYAVTASALSLLMLGRALFLCIAPDSYTLLTRAKCLFRDSLFYLGGLFGALFIERLSGWPALFGDSFSLGF
jgi:protoheme IX farnesyltransferase